MFSGAYTALATPFKNGEVDEAAYRRLIDFQIENGVSGIVPTGSTGEAATLDQEEHLRVIEIAVSQAKGRCRVIAGTGSNSTREAIELSVGAAKLNVDAVLLASPYYNKPTPEGIYRHFKAVSDATDVSIMLYNVPSRTASEIDVETCVRLVRECKNVVSIHEPFLPRAVKNAGHQRRPLRAYPMCQHPRRTANDDPPPVELPAPGTNASSTAQ